MYSTPAEVRLTLAPLLPGELLRDGPDSLPDEQITDAIKEADARIDGYLAARYATPVALLGDGTVPAPVNAWSRDLAAWRLVLTAHKLRPVDPNSPAALRAQQSMADLTAVQKGTYVLTLPVADQPDSTGVPGGGEVAVVPQPGVFGPDDWGIHPRQLLGWGRYGW